MVHFVRRLSNSGKVDSQSRDLMRDFHILFDHGEHSALLDPVYSPYGRFGFPAPPHDRPWTFANFVQTVDGVASLLGPDPSGGDIAQSVEDRWLMDLLRAHADAVLLGMGTLKTEQQAERPRPRGPVFRIMDSSIQQLRAKLRRGPERNIFVSGTGDFLFSDYAAFDGDKVEPYLLTTTDGAARLAPQLTSNPQVRVVVSGSGTRVDLPLAMRKIREQFGFQYLLCEGGPILYGSMMHNHLIDEKFLTIAPFEAGAQVPVTQREPGQPIQRPTVFGGEGFTKDAMTRWHWLSCRKIENHQFNRYRRLP
jgi:riboflavin biosynthesis pyrimidine reductase